VRVAEQGQDDRQPVVATVGVAQRDAQQGVEGLGAVLSPIAHGHQAVVALLKDVAQPDAQNRAHTGALPVPVWRDVGVDQIAQAYVDHEAEQQGQAIDLFTGDGQGWWCHTAKVPRPCPNLASQMPESQVQS